MKSVQQKGVRSSVLFAALFLAANVAMAASGGVGGLTTATTTAQTIQTAFFGFVGACAGCYLLWLAIMAKADKKTWGDFGMGVLHVSLAGASVVLATWAWNLFQ